MDTMEAETATLYELLGRHWTVGTAVTNTVFDLAGQGVAFALADGALAIAPLTDVEPVQDRCRVALDEGRTTISPRRKPVPPLTKVIISDAAPHLTALGTSGFVAADHGRLLRVSASGVTRVVANHGAPIDLIAPGSAGGVLTASGGSIMFYDSNGEVVWLQERVGGHASAMAVSPDGRRFAIAADGLVLVRSFGPRPEPSASFELGSVSALSWSPDGSWLAVSAGKTGIVLVRLADARTVRIPTYPAKAASLSWSADSRVLVTSGAYRMIAWDVSGLDGDTDQPTNLPTGRARFVLVETVDIHPERHLVAAGYADGMVAVARIGQSDELVVRSPGRGAVHGLRWSSDGQHLAFGTSDGEAAIVSFPPHIFK
ncbi:WD40 repeat domain-containing protein [Bradyrhizobium liaoningense]|uniref:WD40 repeat domain-containing protein n=1 Tax=Bradyrhizobium liaoningense TaxID=43992 RepID=UPI001BA4D6F0|nr:WD40 repeat domain-containing protein [Bradyrhizobium liaoningense]MBR0843175.1 WD40 repeat domain-containing protein [Bradyrhizobium liaoningense]